MRYFFMIGVLIAAILCALPSGAEDMHSLGLSYTTMGAGKDQNPSPDGAMRYMAIPHNQQKSSTVAPNSSAPPLPNQDATDQIWKKYKALAAGTYQDTPPTPTKPDAPKEAAPTEQAPPTGISGIIAEYQKNKERQKEMHHIVVTPPAQTAPRDKTN